MTIKKIIIPNLLTMKAILYNNIFKNTFKQSKNIIWM